MKTYNTIIFKEGRVEIKLDSPTTYSTFNFADFDDVWQFKRFEKTIKTKILFEIIDARKDFIEGRTLIKFNDGKYFWKKSELPRGCVKIKALSNGDIVDCYYKKTKNSFTIYRPNPNAKEIFKPLPLKQHIEHKKKFGIY